MREIPIVSGTVLLLTAVVGAFNAWSAVIDPGARQRAFDQIRVGMTHGEVVEILGSEGQFRSFSGPPSVKPGYQGPPLVAIMELRWEAAGTTLDVQFRNSVVTRVVRAPKESPDSDSLWVSRIGLSLLALTGLVLLFVGLRKRPRPLTPPSNP